MAVEVQRQQFQKEVDEFKSYQRDIQKCHQTRQQLMQQSSENEMVLEELNRLDESSNVFKLIGPALIKQDPVEAKANVTKRLDYIKGELDRVEIQLKSLETKAAEKQSEIMKLQKRLQPADQPAS